MFIACLATNQNGWKIISFELIPFIHSCPIFFSNKKKLLWNVCRHTNIFIMFGQNHNQIIINIQQSFLMIILFFSLFPLHGKFFISYNNHLHFPSPSTNTQKQKQKTPILNLSTQHNTWWQFHFFFYISIPSFPLELFVYIKYIVHMSNCDRIISRGNTDRFSLYTEL